MDHKEEYSAKYIADVLASVKTIAMVGASPDPTKFSYGVLRVLHEQGFKMFPINNKPDIKEIRGIKVFSSLDAVDQPIDMVQVFRRADALYGVAEEAINIGAKVLWGQIGVFNEDAASLAEEAGLQVVMNRCPKIELFRPFWKPKLGLGI
ncbi:CoA-binding protein [Rhodobacteraceae bacterium]|jgi:predicted CoA-binding protein|nr:CoA-binding protein [Paracoccaceae bacterium]|tara:strand:- start:838 stop:1287 length:450 start_codon:yes stop_codon:yes gene_type:complete